MSHTWETILATVGYNPVVKKKVAAINADLNAVTEEGYNSKSGII
jgi:hypothetical protein